MQATKIFVQNIPFQTSEKELEALFAEHGEVTSAKIPTDHRSGQTRGYGFIEMKSHNEALSAIKSLNRTKFNGRKINVKFSENKEPKERKRSTAYSYLI